MELDPGSRVKKEPDPGFESATLFYNNLIGEGAVRAHQHVVCNCLPEDFDLKQNFPNPKYLMEYSKVFRIRIGSGFSQVNGYGTDPEGQNDPQNWKIVMKFHV
jgi:hypothetical protein